MCRGREIDRELDKRVGERERERERVRKRIVDSCLLGNIIIIESPV